MSDQFQSPKRRIARAKEHAQTLKRLLQEFSDSKPYGRVIESTPNGFEEHKIKILKKIPDAITDLTYEAIEALRSSLDQAIFVVATEAKLGRPDKVHFPIADDSVDFENSLKSWLKEFPSEFLDLMRRFKPYKEGNKLIWALNRARRESVHRLLVPVVTAASQLRINYVNISSPLPLDLLGPKWDAKKEEMVLIRTGKGSDVSYDIEIDLFVAFGQVEGLAGEPVTGALDAIVLDVESIVSAIEVEARKTGIVQ